MYRIIQIVYYVLEGVSCYVLYVFCPYIHIFIFYTLLSVMSTLKIKPPAILPEMGLLGNSRGITIQDMQTMAKP